MTSQNYHLVIVGYGGMGSYHAKHLLKGNQNIEVSGTYDISEDRRTASMADGYKTYESLAAVLSDDAVDFVLIATPNDVHKDIAIAALNAGKHVICEKPVTIYSADLVEIMETAKINDRAFIVHQNRRWDEDFLTMKKIYDEQIIGDVFHIESRVQGANGIPGDWRHLKEYGGGMLLDWGVHLLDQLLFMIDSKITSVYANFSYILGDDVDDGFQVFITFENGITSLVEVGTTNFIQLPRWYTKGTKGTAVIHDWDINGKIVTQNSGEVEAPKPIKAGQGLTKTMAPPSEKAVSTSDLPKVVKTMESFYENVVSVVEGSAEPIVKNEEVLRVLRLMETIFKSAETNQVIQDFDLVPAKN
ncbi:Gfo/Idh/MocA family protein [Neobacillus cucumis]|uniref:Gfo/Idh/MocA family protein n=1 Tax=Neobacillus cucumis TaxID=1740721 RepID=UPI001964F56C|nr:Gfo/Idh/MocA family oxidoreductase [Neobacillus cucumis]MBM7650809.1 putative dehydrogenase [Neobacillus cucumis]MED4227317.1 Gfo/Idh/MocA family oxidoreductase [Neobacillus cucumis]